MLKRIWLIASKDFFSYLRRPMFWVWLSLICLFYFFLSSGNLTVSNGGDSSIGGIKQQINSEFENTRYMGAFNQIFHSFFVAVLFGLTIIRDLDSGITPLVRSSKLKISEYLFAKFLGCWMLVALIFILNFFATIIFNHALPHPTNAESIGPFVAANFWKPFFKFIFPALLLVSGLSFLLGTITRKPILVFFFPVVMLVMFSLFLNNWSPIWLPNWVNDLLCVADPFGGRWMNQTYFDVDRGADFYNNNSVELSSSFLTSRIVVAVLGGFFFLVTIPWFSRVVRGARHGSLDAINQPVASSGKAVSGMVAETGLGSLGMTQKRTSLFSDIWQIMRYELRELRGSPSLYLFVPFVLLEAVGSTFFNEGTFGTPLLHTPGSLAVLTLETLGILGCLLLMFYTVESQLRERIKKLAPIYYSSQARSFAMLMGKSLANAGVALVVIAATLVACIIILMVQGIVGFDFIPFALVWGLLLIPTFIFWSAFITFAVVLTRNRYSAYALGAAAFAWTIYLRITGDMTWFWNWNLGSTLNWSDVSILEMDRNILILNRLFFLALAVMFVYLASRIYWRRGFDAVQIASRLKPKSFLRFGVKALPFVAVPLVLGIMIWTQVNAGFQGEASEDDQSDYFVRNAATWTDVKQPAISGANIELKIEPAKQYMEVTGILRLINDKEKPMDSFALTTPLHWKDTRWAMQSEFISPEERKLSEMYWEKKEGESEATRIEREKRIAQYRKEIRINQSYDQSKIIREKFAAEEDDTESPETKKQTTDSPDRPKIPGEDGLENYAAEDRSGLHVFRLGKTLMPGDEFRLKYTFSANYPDGATKSGGGNSEFILPTSVVLTSFSGSFIPLAGFQEGVGLEESPESEIKDFTYFEEELRPAFGGGESFHVRTTIVGPEDFIFNGVGVRESETVQDDGLKRTVWETDHPISFFNVVGGRWNVHEGENTEIYYDSEHPYNLEEMSEALDGARLWYGRWFTPYPWKELRVNEFANMAGYAQGFPTNITFSEGIGFLTEDKPGMNCAFMVTAHEAAHQWWGNILVPGEGPGGNILSEGMAHFSSGLLLDKIKGERARIEFFKQIEKQYGESRSVDSERPMIEVDGSKSGDQTVTYDRGGWAFWMLLNHMGRDKNLLGIKAFINYYRETKDCPVIQDFLIKMRKFADDKEAYDEFTRQWFLDTVVPEYQFENVERKQEGDVWVVTGTVKNIGTGKMPLEIAATKNDRFKDDETETSSDYQESRTTVVLDKESEVEFEIRCEFEPEKVLVDPDVKVLQLKRKLAIHEF